MRSGVAAAGVVRTSDMLLSPSAAPVAWRHHAGGTRDRELGYGASLATSCRHASARRGLERKKLQKVAFSRRAATFRHRFRAMISVAQIRAARGLLGWSQSELADRAGLSRSAIARLELGEARAREGTVEAIYRALFRAGVRFIEDPAHGIEGVQHRVPRRRRLSIR